MRQPFFYITFTFSVTGASFFSVFSVCYHNGEDDITQYNIIAQSSIEQRDVLNFAIKESGESMHKILCRTFYIHNKYSVLQSDPVASLKAH